MKHMRKLMALLLAVVMVMAMGVTAFADDISEDLDSNSATYTIKIADGVAGQTYTAYKVFDVTLTTATGNTTNEGFSYTISSTSAWWNTLKGTVDSTTGVYTNSTYGLTFTPSEADATKYVVTNTMTDAQAAALAVALNSVTTKPTAAGSIASYAAGTADTIDVTSSGLGYYFVDTTVGSLCSLDTTNQDVTIEEKNTAPSIKKEFSLDGGTSWKTDNASVNFGQEVTFKITVEVGTGAQNYVLHDSMEAGFAEPTDFAVTYTIGDDTLTWTDGPNYTITTNNLDDDCDFHISFADNALASSGTITVTYKSALTANAEIYGGNMTNFSSSNDTSLNTNTAWLKYGKNNNLSTVQKTINLGTFAIAIHKTDKNGINLAGAKFKIGDSTNTFYFTQDSTSKEYSYAGTVAGDGLTSVLESYVVADSDNEAIVIKGLKENYYTLTEIEAPAGYNALTSTVNINVMNGGTNPIHNSYVATDHYVVYNDGEISNPVNAGEGVHINTGSTPTYLYNIINQSGTELPSTGGMGTTLFYVLGGLMAVGALVILVTNKRMRA